MTLSSLRARIRSLRRKLARPYAQVVVQPIADDFCTEWHCAQVTRLPTPSSQSFVRRVAQAGLRLRTFTAAAIYLEGCAAERREPRPEGAPALHPRYSRLEPSQGQERSTCQTRDL